jgi:hypothetical protein
MTTRGQTVSVAKKRSGKKRSKRNEFLSVMDDVGHKLGLPTPYCHPYSCMWICSLETGLLNIQALISIEWRTKLEHEDLLIVSVRTQRMTSDGRTDELDFPFCNYHKVIGSKAIYSNSGIDKKWLRGSLSRAKKDLKIEIRGMRKSSKTAKNKGKATK